MGLYNPLESCMLQPLNPFGTGSKREASSLMFSALSQIAPELEKEIKDSRWLNAVGVDKDRLILSLNQNVSVI